MHRKALRFFIFLAVLSIIGMAMVQVFWFRQAFDIRREGFSLKAKLALNTVAARLAAYNEHQLPKGNLVEQLSINNYQVMINQFVDPRVLPTFIKEEFEKQQIISDFEFAIYTCEDNALNYGGRVCMEQDCATSQSNSTILPYKQIDQNYFLVHLPDSLFNILSGMQIWLFSTVVLIIVIFFFLYTLYFILRQKKLSEIQTDFVNNMTHEFQTPLASILLAGKTILKPTLQNNPKKIAVYANLICKEGERLKRNVDTILKTSDVKTQQMEFSVLSVHELLQNIANTKKLLLEQVNITIAPQAKIDTILADRLHLYNVIENLLDNSIKYSTGDAEISLSTYNDQEHLFLEIKDQGVGISKKQQKLIFNKFYRVPTTDLTQQKGFGLGLYYVKKVIEAHDGSIQVKSNTKGSTFKLAFKLFKNETNKKGKHLIARR